MCGRFALTDPRAIVDRFGFMDWSDKRPEPRFNIAPSQEILTIVQMPLEEPRPQTAVWGLKPFWLQKGKAPPINARAEAIGASAMFRDALRCLIPATGFYEWREKRPMHIRRRDSKVFMFAGLWLPAGRRWTSNSGDHYHPTKRPHGHHSHAHASHFAGRWTSCAGWIQRSTFPKRSALRLNRFQRNSWRRTPSRRW